MIRSEALDRTALLGRLGVFITFAEKAKSRASSAHSASFERRNKPHLRVHNKT